VISRRSFSGAHAGEFMGIRPTGRRVTVAEMTFDRFWQKTPLVVRVSALPGLGKANVDATVAQEKKAPDVKVTKVALAGASEAYITVLPLGTQANASLYAVYPGGELLVSLSGPGITAAKALAVAKAAIA